VEILVNYVNVIFYVLAFLIGGIPVGVLLTRIFYGIDLQKVGSGSIGATNVYRALKDIDSKKAKIFSITTLILDALKGTLVVLLAKVAGLSYGAQWLIAILAIIGHCYSLYLGFGGL